ncbi:hypothetical protein F2Q70_00037019 [Brassica cretica]|uniref:Uncharacterized protein n=1 Tax=Brassica cretica TaxID=69181 RepID=A0A8S9JTG5_BRACR|nr:hypothetical protein F2Q70_00037019 [Brassica cretica]
MFPPLSHLVMSTENLDCGIGPLRLGARRVWAEDLISRKTAGLAGWYCAVLGSKRDDPKEPRSTLMSHTLLPPHFIGDLKKQKRERESERKTSHRQKKWRSGYREATVVSYLRKEIRKMHAKSE